MAFSFVFKKSDTAVHTDNFESGISNWTSYDTGGDTTMDWYQSNSLRLSINTGSATEEDRIHATWNSGLSGDFDIEAGYKRLSVGSTSSPRFTDYGFYVVPTTDLDGNENAVRIVQVDQSTHPNMTSWYEYNNVIQNTINNPIKPDPTLDNLRLRITKAGATFTTYVDKGDGTWLLGGQFTATPFENITMKPSFHAYRYSSTSVSVQFTYFKVNSGTIV